MKKLLITLTAAGALALPVGVAMAQDDVVETDDAVSTVEPERERTQLRLHEEDGAECDGTRTQERSRVHVEDGSGVGTQAENGWGQDGAGGGTQAENGRGQGGAGGGDQVRTRSADASGDAAQGAALRTMHGHGRDE
jgi:hypothetical protein